jgi:hypothetical protein
MIKKNPEVHHNVRNRVMTVVEATVNATKNKYIFVPQNSERNY